MVRTGFFTVALCAIAVLSGCTTKQAKQAGINYSYMDLSARPGDNFARYATGLWAENNDPQPPEYPAWGTIYKISDDNTKILAGMIQEIAEQENEKGSIAQKIGDLYNMMMDSVRLNSEGAEPLQKELDEIRAISSREEFLERCATKHDHLLFGLFVSPDEKNSTDNIVCISQGGLSLGNRDYYLSDDPQAQAILEALKEHIVNLFKLTGYPEEEAEAKMQRIIGVEMQIAEPYYSQEMQRVPEANYHKMSVDELTSVCGGFDWKTYLCNNRYDQTTEVDLGQPEPVAKSCEILMTAPLEVLKDIYECATISAYAQVLSDDFSDEAFDFRRKLTGAESKTPRWKMAVSLVDGLMSDAVGQMFVERYFPAEAKTEMIELVENLRTSLGERIKAQEWMSEETKAVALDKLAAYGVKVGYPDKWDDLTGLEIDPSKSLLENVKAAQDFYWNLNYSKEYNKPVDREEWGMSPQTVNAYYNPLNNEICFPAGFLQPPLFDLNSDAAANYGSIGVVIGHEMTHGFDDQGRQYDKNGNMCQWWSDEDVAAFQIPAEQLAVYFDSLWVIPGELHANGHLCLGENIADHGGLNIAYDAFQIWQQKHGRLQDDNGFTPEQRFFLSYANAWAGTTSVELLRYLTMMDVHSADFLRVNGALSQCEYWYDAFDIQPGDSLYVAPENRVKIW
ncbi:MAG: M13 family metallopeptidase [Bacteroidaceae bacterium]|nr:M13 family metallopeptidase [Bacteroidaceae bacterium]